ncbi:hypothetical protein ACFYTQ_13325 [Nocardia sp. NPDC004068]|uniref:hypothetical protein n=1 Tax=Nocardia sp. NPDC004068 TaxID=3364303 RepID=UPI00367B4914
MSADEDETHQGTRLYSFPGGMLEVQESPGDEPGTGVYLEFYIPRQSHSGARGFGPGEVGRLDVVDDGPEVA